MELLEEIPGRIIHKNTNYKIIEWVGYKGTAKDNAETQNRQQEGHHT